MKELRPGKYGGRKFTHFLIHKSPLFRLDKKTMDFRDNPLCLRMLISKKMKSDIEEQGHGKKISRAFWLVDIIGLERSKEIFQGTIDPKEMDKAIQDEIDKLKDRDDITEEERSVRLGKANDFRNKIRNDSISISCITGKLKGSCQLEFISNEGDN